MLLMARFIMQLEILLREQKSWCWGTWRDLFSSGISNHYFVLLCL